MRFGIILVDPNGFAKLSLSLSKLSPVHQNVAESISCFLVVRIELHCLLKRHKGFLPIPFQTRHTLLIIALGLSLRLLRRRAAAQDHNRDGHDGKKLEGTRSHTGHEISSKWVSRLKARKRSWISL